MASFRLSRHQRDNSDSSLGKGSKGIAKERAYRERILQLLCSAEIALLSGKYVATYEAEAERLTQGCCSWWLLAACAYAAVQPLRLGAMAHDGTGQSSKMMQMSN